MTQPFYRAFEDKYRGSRELIQERLRVYLPYVVPLAGLHPGLPALDLGCGRGEWLELMSEHSIAAQGVDLDLGMLTACRERGFNVLHTDALAHLQAQNDHSLLFITGFHIAEHLPFALLQALLTQAIRALVPGGLLILETPNPENLLVGACHFYMDPTHQRPLPSQMLSFLAEYHGFNPVKLLRLQEPAHLRQDTPVSLYDVLANVSPDYAIVAQAPAATPTRTPQPAAAAALTQQLSNALAQDHGLSLATLANRYEQQLATQHQIREVLATVQQLETLVRQQALQLNTVHASLSWRITRPLRWLAKHLSGQPKQG